MKYSQYLSLPNMVKLSPHFFGDVLRDDPRCFTIDPITFAV